MAKTRYRSRRRAATARTRTVFMRPAKRRGRIRKALGGINLMHVAAASVALSYIGTHTGFGQTIASKIPGNKTFGAGAALGVTCLVANMVKPNKWLKLAGIAGVVLAGSQLGVQGTNFSYVGEVGALDGFQSVSGDDDDYVSGYADDEYED